MYERLGDIPLPNFLAAPKCCCCGAALDGRVHLVYLDYTAQWVTPTWHESGCPVLGAVAVLCGVCYAARRMSEIRFAVERRPLGTEVGVVYHDVKELLPLPVPVRDN